MNIKKTELENNILVIANSFGRKQNYQALLNPTRFGSVSFTKIVEMIIYEMFLNKFDKNNCHPDEFEAYENILAFTQELNDKGYVKW